MPQPRASLPEPRDREKQYVPSSVVQRTPHPKGRREAWAIIQGLLLTDDPGSPIPCQGLSLTVCKMNSWDYIISKDLPNPTHQFRSIPV